MDVDLSSLLRMAAAVAAGGAIGFNRDIHGKPTGIRAHALVSLGAALLVIAGSGPHIDANDPAAASRIIQGIVAGVGFLGAGVILRGTGARVYHLTTAASLWVTTGIGVLCGLGAWTVAGIATVLVLVVLVVGQSLDKWLYGISGIKDDDRE
ncbi:MAG TPA: MgtC/SapB family protein [Reyranella sp.]|jgi:putative Mg2+ transporter-C (MgtC) family protein|nr:MgtC/SapB family protein [Reyranella sp.]